MTNRQCPICFTSSDDLVWDHNDEKIRARCARCGHFYLSEDAAGYWSDKYFHNKKTRQVANASSWIYHNYTRPYIITEDDVKNFEKMRQPSFHERADLLLLFFEKCTEFIGQEIQYDTNRALAATWSYNDDEVHTLSSYLESIGRITSSSFGNTTIEPDGWEHLERIKERNPASLQGFVAMWFDAGIQSVYNSTIAPAIEEAGYKPHRVDLREHNDKIDDEIIVQIRRSRFIVADLTGHRGGVYYEAGFAHGLGLQVFFTCRDDHFEQLHFDIRQYNCIKWDINKLEEFKTQLSKRIEAVLGKGNYQGE